MDYLDACSGRAEAPSISERNCCGELLQRGTNACADRTEANVYGTSETTVSRRLLGRPHTFPTRDECVCRPHRGKRCRSSTTTVNRRLLGRPRVRTSSISVHCHFSREGKPSENVKTDATLWLRGCQLVTLLPTTEKTTKDATTRKVRSCEQQSSEGCEVVDW